MRLLLFLLLYPYSAVVVNEYDEPTKIQFCHPFAVKTGTHTPVGSQANDEGQTHRHPTRNPLALHLSNMRTPSPRTQIPEKDHDRKIAYVRNLRRRAFFNNLDPISQFGLR